MFTKINVVIVVNVTKYKTHFKTVQSTCFSNSVASSHVVNKRTMSKRKAQKMYKSLPKILTLQEAKRLEAPL